MIKTLHTAEITWFVAFTCEKCRSIWWTFLSFSVVSAGFLPLHERSLQLGEAIYFLVIWSLVFTILLDAFDCLNTSTVILEISLSTVQNYVPEDPESPSSPGSSYNNPQLVAQDFEREPPELPPQAEITPLNGPSFSMDSSQSLTRPQTFVLNHLYIQKMNQNVVALSSTHRFCTKHVTIVLYKPRRG